MTNIRSLTQRLSFPGRRRAVAPLELHRLFWLRIWIGCTLLFLYAPIIVLVVFSFNDSKRNVVWRGFTLKYYEKAFANSELVLAFGNTLTIAVISTIISVILGSLAAVLL